VRVPQPVDPNPLLQMAAEEDSLFDPVHPLPERPQPPKRERRKKLRPKLPDHWPIAQLPVTAPKPAPPIMAESFEVLAYRTPTPAEEPITILATDDSEISPSLVFSPAESSPPPPKLLTARQRRERFTWESPEMYQEE
jgi:hypothetical protein